MYLLKTSTNWFYLCSEDDREESYQRRKALKPDCQGDKNTQLHEASEHYQFLWIF